MAIHPDRADNTAVEATIKVRATRAAVPAVKDAMAIKVEVTAGTIKGLRHGATTLVPATFHAPPPIWLLPDR